MTNKKDLIILGVGKILQVAIALISTRILTEILSTEEVGNYYLLITFLSLFNFSLLNPLGQYYGRHLIHWEHTKNLLNATNILLFLRITAISFSLFIAFIIHQAFGYDKYYTISEFLFFIFIALLASTHGVLLSAVNTLGNRVKFTVYIVATLSVGLILSLVFIYCFNKSAISWLYGLFIAELFFSVGLYKYLVKNNRFSFHKVKLVMQNHYIKKVAIFIVPVTITLFLQWGQSQSYRFIIENKYSLNTLSYIGVGLAVASAIFNAVESLAAQFYNSIYLRQITHANKEERGKAWNDLVSYMIPIYLLLTVFVISLAPYLTNILVAEKFNEAYIFVIFGAMVEFFRVLTNLVYMVSQSEVKTNTTIFPYTIGFILTVGSLYFIDMSEKLWMIPLSLSLSYFATFLFLFLNMRKLLKIKISIMGIIKVIIMSSPLLLVFLFVDDKTILQALLLVLGSGIYFLILIYLIVQKEILEVTK